MNETTRLTPEKESEFRACSFHRVFTDPTALLAEIDALRIEREDYHWVARQLLSAVAGLKAGQPCHWLEHDWPRINAVMGIDTKPVGKRCGDSRVANGSCIYDATHIGQCKHE